MRCEHQAKRRHARLGLLRASGSAPTQEHVAAEIIGRRYRRVQLDLSETPASGLGTHPVGVNQQRTCPRHKRNHKKKARPKAHRYGAKA